MAQKSLWRTFKIDNSQEFEALQAYWRSNQEAWKKYYAIFQDGWIETNLPYPKFREWFRGAIGKPAPDFYSLASASSAYPSWEAKHSIEQNGAYVSPADIAKMLELAGDSPILRYCQRGIIPAIKEKRAWLIKKQDAEEFVKKYRDGQVGRRGFANPDHPLHGRGRLPEPNPPTQKGEFTQMYLPCPPEHASQLSDILKPAERLAILDYYAGLKQDDPTGFEYALEFYQKVKETSHG